MPSTYTLNNGIELIATGEQSGTWGDTTNTNLELLDTALDGQVTVTLSSAGSSGSPNTLPISDGAASNGRNRMVIFNDSSDLGATAYVQLTPNDAEKIVYVRNSLSGSRSILLFQGTYSASNDYEIPAGTTAVIFFDGAGSGAVAANVFNNAHFDNLNIAGDVTIGDDLSLNSDGAIINIGADNDLQISHSGSAGTITNITGNLTIDSTASDTDIIFKGTDGATDTTALTLDMSAAGKAIFNAGASFEDAVTFNSATATGFIQASSNVFQIGSSTDDPVDFYENNTFKMRLTDGDLLLGGITSPLTNFGDGRTTIALQGSGAYDYATVQMGNNGTNANDQILGVVAFHDGTERNAQMSAIRNASTTDADLVFYTRPSGGSLTERLRINSDSNGVVVNDTQVDMNFRVATSNSSATFFVDGQYDGVALHSTSPVSYANAQAVLFIEDNANPALAISDTGQARDWYIAGLGDGLAVRYADGSNTGSASNVTEAMFFKNTGFVGVGATSSPLSGLHLSDGTNAGSPQNASREATLMIDAGATASADIPLMVRNGYNQHIFFGDAADANIGMINYDHNTNHMNFTVNATQVLVIDEGGDVGIGTSNPVADLAIVDPTSQSGIEFQPEVATNTNRITNYDRTDNSYQKFRVDALEHSFYISGTERFRIEDTSSTLRVGNTTNAGFVDFDGSSLQFNTQRDPNTGSFVNTGRAHASITLSDGNGTGDSKIRLFTATSNNTTATSRLEVLHNGDVEITNGNLVMGTSGNGIDFSITNDNSGAEVLDDYEEGEFTYGITLTGSGSYSVRAGYQTGRYVKVGSMVMVQCRFETSSNNSAVGDIKFTGLPFSANSNPTNGNGSGQFPILFRGNSQSNVASHFVGIVQSSTTMSIFEQEAGATGISSVNASTVTGNFEGTFGFCYSTGET